MANSKPKYLYLNIYEHPGNPTISYYHASRAEADEAAKKRPRDDRVSCIRVEFREGQIDPDESFFLNINEFNNSYTLSQVLYPTREAADSAQTKGSKHIACVRVPLVKGRYDE